MERVGNFIARERELESDESYFARLGEGHGLASKSDVAAFDALVRPLELKQGYPLNGPNRALCIAAFRSNPEMFERMVGKAEAGASRGKPVGLLVRMVKDGDQYWTLSGEAP